jgi:hypothetical protein
MRAAVLKEHGEPLYALAKSSEHVEGEAANKAVSLRSAASAIGLVGVGTLLAFGSEYKNAAAWS